MKKFFSAYAVQMLSWGAVFLLLLLFIYFFRNNGLGAYLLVGLLFLLLMFAFYFRLWYKQKSLLVDETRIRTPLPIVYGGRKGLHSLPYLDLNQLKLVWGIELNGTLFKMKDTVMGYSRSFDYQTVLRLVSLEEAKFNPRQEIYLPTKEQLIEARRYRKHWELTVMILNRYNIAAENFYNQDYWCEGEDIPLPFVVPMDPKELADGYQPNEKQRFALRLISY